MAGAPQGPLAGLRILEIEGIGPAPYCGMLLADMGADVVRIARPGADRGPHIPVAGATPLDRGRRIVALDLKSADGVAAARALAAAADALIEGLRPGAMERLRLGPEDLAVVNRALVYVRVTGWGQDGPMARMAGHDLTYIALSGALAAIGPPDRPPPPPLNLIGDFGGGGLWAAFGLVCALLEARTSGRGRVVDAAMLDGAASQMTMIRGMRESGGWSAARQDNLLDGGAPFYRCYACADGRYLAVAPIEPAFFRAFLQGIGLDPAAWDQDDRTRWSALAERIAEILATRPRDAWAARFDGTDACVAPVLTMDEAAAHPQNSARATFAAAGPRMDGVVPARPPRAAQVDEVLASWRAVR